MAIAFETPMVQADTGIESRFFKVVEFLHQPLLDKAWVRLWGFKDAAHYNTAIIENKALDLVKNCIQEFTWDGILGDIVPTDADEAEIRIKADKAGWSDSEIV
jgi:hypothetical protein